MGTNRKGRATLNKNRWWICLCVCVLSLALGATLAGAGTPVSDMIAPSAEHAGILDTVTSAPDVTAADVEALLDRIIEEQMEAESIVGATVSVVAKGDVLLSKGYGIADMGEGAPMDVDEAVAVDPERTLFRVGSISKLFVWTAVMQLVQQGQLDLDADINEYVDFEIPNRLHRGGKSSAAPITLKHLMSHSAGFEDVPEDLFHLREEQALPLDDYIRTHVPARVFPPGEVSAYSNYGSALAGYIVQRAAGIPFEQYIEENIFAPLRMQHSTFRQPVEPALADDVARGYRFVDGRFIAGDFVYALGPAGGMSGTSADMARFMLAHLHGGTLDGRSILSSDALRHMHAPLFSQHEAVDGMAHGFLEQTRNGRRVLYHMGSVLLFNSGMYLVPREEVGLFVSFNGGSHLGPMTVFEEFMNELYSDVAAQESAGVANGGSAAAANADGVDTAVSTVGEADPSGSPGVEALTGEYYINRRSFTTDASVLSLMETMRVEAGDGGSLYVTHLGQREEFVETAPGMYRNLDPASSLDPYGDFAKIVFKEGSAGHTFLVSDGPMSYTKAPWYAATGFTVAAILIPVLVLVGTGVVWLVQALVALIRSRSMRRMPSMHRTRGAMGARTLAGLFVLVTVVLLFGALTVSGDMEPAYGVPKSYFGIEPDWAPALDGLPPIMIAFAVAMVICSVAAWREKWWNRGGRIHYTFVTACALLLLAVLRGWHVI